MMASTWLTTFGVVLGCHHRELPAQYNFVVDEVVSNER
jgi:hypothetical protein